MNMIKRWFNKKTPRWSEQEEALIQYVVQAWVLINMEWSLLQQPAKEPLGFKIYADYNYGALVAMMQRCLDFFPEEDALRVAQYFLVGYKNDLHKQNSKLAETWLQHSFSEPNLERPKLNEVAYVGYSVMCSIFLNKVKPGDTGALVYLTVDAKDPQAFFNTLTSLIEKYQNS